MPKLKTRTADRPHNYARVFEAFGTIFVSNGDPVNIRAETCPFCAGAKFYLNVQTGQYDCKSMNECGESGNLTTYLTWIHRSYLEQTEPGHYLALKAKRGIASQTLKLHELAYDAVTDCWLIPFKNKQGNIVNLMRYYPNKKSKPNKYLLPELPSSLFNFHKLSADKEKIILLFEGPFDAIAADYNIGATKRAKYDILAIPGAFKEAWVEYFRDRKVRALFDNDEGGKQHNERVRKLLGESGSAAELRLLKWPPGYNAKDINDLVRNYPNLSVVGFSLKNSIKVTAEPKLLIHHGRRPATDERPIDWPWPDHLRCGTYVSFSGRMGTFKTTIALDLAARYSTGRPMPLCDKVGMPAGHVLYIYAEDDRDRVENDYEWAGGNFDHWHCMSAKTKDDDPLNILDHLGEIEQLIREYDIRLVIIDGQNSVVGAPNISTDMLARHNVTNKLHQFAQRLNICLIGIRNEDGDGRALGPQSMGDIGRCVLRAVEDEPKSDPPDCLLKFVKVQDTARSNYPPIPYSVKDHGGSRREILWGKSMEDDLRELEIRELTERLERR
jgi:hypothetical protein